MFSTYEAYSRMHVKPGYKRMQYYRSYTTTKAYNSLARMYLEMCTILKLYSTQYCSLLAQVKVVYFKKSEAAIA
jgi:hypothetical protein